LVQRPCERRRVHPGKEAAKCARIDHRRRRNGWSPRPARIALPHRRTSSGIGNAGPSREGPGGLRRPQTGSEATTRSPGEREIPRLAGTRGLATEAESAGRSEEPRLVGAAMPADTLEHACPDPGRSAPGRPPTRIFAPKAAAPSAAGPQTHPAGD
jgi:hypothetical protein